MSAERTFYEILDDLEKQLSETRMCPPNDGEMMRDDALKLLDLSLELVKYSVGFRPGVKE